MSRRGWRVDPEHSSLRFSVRHMLLTRIQGRLPRWEAKVEWNAQQPKDFHLEVAVDLRALNTDAPARDERLRGPEFFDVQRFPEARFLGKRVESLGPGEFVLIGDLTLHGVTREVSLDVKHTGSVTEPWGTERAGFEAFARIDRRDFGLAWERVLLEGGLVVSDQVEIEVQVEAVGGESTVEIPASEQLFGLAEMNSPRR